jgi:hypothetical protein
MGVISMEAFTYNDTGKRPRLASERRETMTGTITVYSDNRNLGCWWVKNRDDAERLLRAFDHGQDKLHGIWQSPVSMQTYPIIVR